MEKGMEKEERSMLTDNNTGVISSTIIGLEEVLTITWMEIIMKVSGKRICAMDLEAKWTKMGRYTEAHG